MKLEIRKSRSEMPEVKKICSVRLGKAPGRHFSPMISRLTHKLENIDEKSQSAMSNT